MKITAKLIYTPECKEDCMEISKKKKSCDSCIHGFYYECDCRYGEWFVYAD